MNARRLRWHIAGLFFAATVINYVDRQALSILAPVLTKELRLSPIQYSNILQAFLYAYTFMYLVSGVLVDRWGTRLSMTVFMTWWSAGNMLHAFASSASGLGAVRFLLGAGEPGNFMAAAKATSEWYPPKERALVNGLVNAGASVGAVASPPLIVWLYLHFGWRSAFVMTGILGLIWLIPWNFICTAPRIANRAVARRWPELLGFRQTWGLFFARFLSDPVWWFYLFWLPKYLVEQRGFNMVQVGMLAWMPYLSADIGSIFGGLLSGWLVKRQWAPLRARTACMVPFALAMPVSIGIASTPSATLALALICLVTFCHMAWKTNLMTVTNDAYPSAVVGSVAGIAAFGNGLGAALFTSLAGYLVQHFSYRIVFVLMGFMHPAALVLFVCMVRKPVPYIKAETVGEEDLVT